MFQEGDLLEVNGVRYTIRSIELWEDVLTFGGLFQIFETTRGDLYRSPSSVNGRRGDPVLTESEIVMTPVDPLAPDRQPRTHLGSMITLYETYIEGTDLYYELQLEKVE